MHYLKLSIFIFAWFIFSSFNLFSQSNLNINGGLGVGKIARGRSYSSSSSSSLWKPNFSLGLSHNLFVDDTRYISSGIYFNLANAKQTSKQSIRINDHFEKNDFSIISNSAYAGLGGGLGARRFGLDFNIELRLLYLLYSQGQTKNLKTFDYSSGQIISANEKWDNFYGHNIELGLNLFLGYEVIPNFHIGVSSYIGLNRMFSQPIYNSDVTGISEIEGRNINIQASVKYDLWHKTKSDKKEKTTLEEEDKVDLDSINNMFVLKTYPFLYLSEVNFGLEFISNRKFSHEIIVAYHFSDSYIRYLDGFIIDNFLESESFHSASPKYGVSLRYNLSLIKRKKANLWRNITFQLMLKRTEFEDLTNVYEYSYENLDVSKTVIGFKFLPSYSKIVGKHFYLNYYVGVGWRFMFYKQEIFHTEYTNPDTGEVTINNNIEISKGVSYTPTLHIGISLGYVFHKK